MNELELQENLSQKTNEQLIDIIIQLLGLIRAQDEAVHVIDGMR